MDLGVIMILGMMIQQRLGVIILMEFACGDRRIWGRKLGQLRSRVDFINC